MTGDAAETFAISAFTLVVLAVTIRNARHHVWLPRSYILLRWNLVCELLLLQSMYIFWYIPIVGAVHNRAAFLGAIPD